MFPVVNPGKALLASCGSVSFADQRKGVDRGIRLSLLVLFVFFVLSSAMY